MGQGHGEPNEYNDACWLLVDNGNSHGSNGYSEAKHGFRRTKKVKAMSEAIANLLPCALWVKVFWICTRL
jgi:hypothetical protein